MHAVQRVTSSRRVLILGDGFGGIYAALELERILARRTGLEVTLVTRDNFFLFTPMLHEVAASDLELSTIVNPLRKLLRRIDTFVGQVANVLGVRFSGFVAWWLWRTIYLSKLPRLEKKVRVALDWTLDLCFAKDFACLSDGRAARPRAVMPAAREAGVTS